MARLRNQNLTSLTPAQRKFWNGLRPAPELGPTDSVFKMPSQKPQKRKTYAPSHGNIAEADTPIMELATKAAQWLVEHWPKKVSEIGYAAFKAARIAEILQGNFGGPYWENCPLENESTWRATPTCDLSIAQPPLHLQTTGSKNSLCKYTTATEDTGNAGFSGSTKANGFFTDDWLKEKQFLFKIPEPKTKVGVRPIFTRHDNTWKVTHQYLNHQPWCSLYKASAAKAIADFKDRSVSVDKIGRYFYWAWKVEQPAVGGSQLNMQRSFTVDALYLSHDFGYDPNEEGFCLVQLAPASCRGMYHYGNTSILTDLTTAAQCWVALAEDDTHDPACAPDVPQLFEWAYTSNPRGVSVAGSGAGAPCSVSWYVVIPSICDQSGFCWPTTDPRHKLSSLRLLGAKFGLSLTLPVVPLSLYDPYTGPDIHDAPGTHTICGPDYGVKIGVGTLICSVNEKCLPHEAYYGWGYTAWNSCTEQYKTHSLAGKAPLAAQFALDWMNGRYPL